MGTICTRVEAMANDSKSKSPRTLYEYACTISYEFAEIIWIITRDRPIYWFTDIFPDI